MGFSNPDDKRAYDRAYTSKPEVKEKRKEAYRKWKDLNRDRLLEREAKRRLEKRAKVLVATVRTRARKRGLEFDLDEHVQDLQRRVDMGVCEVTGQPFDLSPGRKYNSPSLDRIDPSKGYTHRNVRIVLNLVNAAMGDWGEEVLFRVMSDWVGK